MSKDKIESETGSKKKKVEGFKMKKYSKIIFVIFLIIFSAGLWLLNSNITRVPLLSDDNFILLRAGAGSY